VSADDIVLRVAGASKRFGGVQALSDVGITITQGQVYGLIGPNGAGKTTFFNVLTGLYTPDSGSFELGGAPYKPSAVHEVAKAGIARTFQNIRLFAEMTALENVMVGRHVRTHSGLFGAVLKTSSFRHEEAAIAKRSQELLDYVGIGKYTEYKARTLSYGDQRRLEIARALATDPKLIALDEPAAGMNGGAARADRPHPQRRPHDPADRARREARHGPVRPRHRARLRQADRRGQPLRRAARPEGDRGLSGRGAQGALTWQPPCSRSAR
jgi:branched-chain amino acid transport system ATP-binding protein